MSQYSGVPSPSEWWRHQPITVASAANGGDPARTLFEGATCANGVELLARFPIAGASAARVRFKATAAGSLRFYFVRPDGTTKYTAGNPTVVAVTADAETFIDTNAIYGEAWAYASFLPSGAGTVTFVDVMVL